jgi:C-terminal processing protease CtpA/Prc
LKQDEVDAHDLDQVGVTLKRDGARFVIAGVATKDGRPTVDAIVPGDTLLRVNERDVTGATLGSIYRALHGKPGEARTITIERHGVSRQVTASVTRF